MFGPYDEMLADRAAYIAQKAQQLAEAEAHERTVLSPKQVERALRTGEKPSLRRWIREKLQRLIPRRRVIPHG